MNEIIEQYFDLSLMVEALRRGPRRVLDDPRTRRSSPGVLALVWGLVLALLRQLPGRASRRCDS